jgi:hypothetical protein
LLKIGAQIRVTVREISGLVRGRRRIGTFHDDRKLRD